MGDEALARRPDADRRVRPRRDAGRGSDRDAGDLSVGELPAITLYHSSGCHLCDKARETLVRLHAELGFRYTEIDISGDPALEATYREWLPVVEVDGERAFVYHLDEAALRRRIAVTN